MDEKAAGVRSMTLLVRQEPPQQVASPQKLVVRGPQSATVTHTVAPEHWCLTFITEPQPRRGMFSPQVSGLVMSQQAADVFGQAAMFLLDWQVPQAPVPALPQDPQALPQQNQVASPAQRLVDPQAMSLPFTGAVRISPYACMPRVPRAAHSAAVVRCGGAVELRGVGQRGSAVAIHIGI
jgi:hypothetical protein